MHAQSNERNPYPILGVFALLSAGFAALAVAEGLRGAAARRKLKLAVADSREARRRLEETAILRHDYRKHLDVVRKMLSDGQTKRALSYLDRLCDRTEQVLGGKIVTGNYLVDLILSSRLAAARENGVRVCVTAAHVPETLRISDDALSSLLCNAIDNAVAAAGENGWINIDLHGKGQMLYIGVVNSRSDAAAPEGSDVRRKGYGQLIMRRIVEHYHGVMETERYDESYRLSLLLPVIS